VSSLRVPTCARQLQMTGIGQQGWIPLVRLLSHSGRFVLAHFRDCGFTNEQSHESAAVAGHFNSDVYHVECMGTMWTDVCSVWLLVILQSRVQLVGFPTYSVSEHLTLYLSLFADSLFVLCRNVRRQQAADHQALDVAHGVPPPRAAPPLLRRVVLSSTSFPFGHSPITWIIMSTI